MEVGSGTYQENINFLEEFIIYNLHIGFDHFYLYDNENSTNFENYVKNKNLYQF